MNYQYVALALSGLILLALVLIWIAVYFTPDITQDAEQDCIRDARKLGIE